MHLMQHQLRTNHAPNCRDNWKGSPSGLCRLGIDGGTCLWAEGYCIAELARFRPRVWRVEFGVRPKRNLAASADRSGQPTRKASAKNLWLLSLRVDQYQKLQEAICQIKVFSGRFCPNVSSGPCTLVRQNWDNLYCKIFSGRKVRLCARTL